MKTENIRKVMTQSVYSVKNVKSQVGHDGCMTVSGTVYKNGKRLGTVAEEYMDCSFEYDFKDPKEVKEMKDFSEKLMGEFGDDCLFQTLCLDFLNEAKAKRSKKKTFFIVEGDHGNATLFQYDCPYSQGLENHIKKEDGDKLIKIYKVA